MDAHQLEVLRGDEREVVSLADRTAVAAKLLAYAFLRPTDHAALKRRLSPRLKHDPVFRSADLLLKNQGGMFKKHCYGIAARMRPIRGATVLVPGAGYGRNFLQLASLRPKEIIAFDLYPYPEAWSMVARTAKERFGVPVTFLHGDFDVVPQGRKGTFDHVISDAVLEHVPDMPAFARHAFSFLAPGGVFYASYGPLWYGPEGDHVTWSPDGLFDHLLLPKEEYAARVKARVAVSKGDSCDPGFLIEEELFSYLKAEEYLRDMDAAGFLRRHLFAKIMLPATELLERKPELHVALDARGVPAFDRYCGGMYLWATKPGPAAH